MATTSIGSVITRVQVLIERVRSGVFSPADPAAAYAAIEQLRRLADGHEINLMRALRWDAKGKPVRTWLQVGQLMDGQFSDRTAVRKRWNRLIAPTRRTVTGDHRLGAALPRDHSVPQ